MKIKETETKSGKSLFILVLFMLSIFASVTQSANAQNQGVVAGFKTSLQTHWNQNYNNIVKPIWDFRLKVINFFKGNFNSITNTYHSLMNRLQSLPVVGAVFRFVDKVVDFTVNLWENIKKWVINPVVNFFKWIYNFVVNGVNFDPLSDSKLSWIIIIILFIVGLGAPLGAISAYHNNNSDSRVVVAKINLVLFLIIAILLALSILNKDAIDRNNAIVYLVVIDVFLLIFLLVAAARGQTGHAEGVSAETGKKIATWIFNAIIWIIVAIWKTIVFIVKTIWAILSAIPWIKLITLAIQATIVYFLILAAAIALAGVLSFVQAIADTFGIAMAALGAMLGGMVTQLTGTLTAPINRFLSWLRGLIIPSAPPNNTPSGGPVTNR